MKRKGERARVEKNTRAHSNEMNLQMYRLIQALDLLDW